MSGHVPECPCSEICNEWGGDGDHRMTHSGSCIVCGLVCICPALRACTVRVLGEVRGAVAAEAVNPWPVQNEFDVAYIAGHEDQMRDVLAAIDRLAQEAP